MKFNVWEREGATVPAVFKSLCWFETVKDISPFLASWIGRVEMFEVIARISCLEAHNSGELVMFASL